MEQELWSEPIRIRVGVGELGPFVQAATQGEPQPQLPADPEPTPPTITTVGEGSTRPTKPADWVPYTNRTKKHTFIVERATFEAFKAAAARRDMSIAEAIDRAMLAWIKS